MTGIRSPIRHPPDRSRTLKTRPQLPFSVPADLCQDCIGGQVNQGWERRRHVSAAMVDVRLGALAVPGVQGKPAPGSVLMGFFLCPILCPAPLRELRGQVGQRRKALGP